MLRLRENSPQTYLILLEILVILKILLGFSAHAAGSAPLKIVALSADTLTARFTLPPLQINEAESGTTVHFAGADWTLDAGKPRLPVFTQLIGIPVVGTPTVTVIRAHPEVKTIQAVAAVSNPVKEAESEDISPVTGFYPKPLVEVVPSGFVREQRIAGLQINPVQFNPATRQLKVFSVVEFRIHFPGAPVAPTAPVSTLANSRHYEAMFRGMLFNYTQARQWQKPRHLIENRASVTAIDSGNDGLQDRNRTSNASRQYERAAPAAPQVTNTHRFKIPVTQTDLYRITYNNLRIAGITPETINLDSIRLDSGGQKQGIYLFDENENGVLDSGEKLIFYGRALIDNKFTDENIYWLSFSTLGELGSDETSRVAERDVTPRTPNLVTPQAFFTRIRVEEDVHHDVLAGPDIKSELADHYFWVAFRAGHINTSRKDIPITLPGAAPRLEINRNATLRIKFQGASRRGVALHKARLTFNGRLLGRVAEWKRQASHIVTRDFQQLFIHPDQNFLRIEALDANSTADGEYHFYLDWYEFDYWHDFNAERNRLEFNSNTEPRSRGTVQYRVTNFFEEQIDAYQLGDGGITSRLVGGEVTRRGATYHLLFEDNITQHTRYFVIGNKAYRSINALVPTPLTPLRNPANQADYIVITHPTFRESIQPLVEFRRSQGLTTQVVDIGDIYDDFSDGLFNPFAIQRFLRYAYTSWQQPAPTYVVLVGDAHYDYKNATVERYRRDPSFRGTYELYPIFVPTYHGWAPESGETSMDQRFVNISGEDALPDMLIGRLSVQTAEELDVMVRKIINYEQNLKTGRWQGTLIQVADDNSDNPSDGIFEASRNELIRDIIPVGYDTREIYLRKLKSPVLTGSQIRRALNEGALAIEYAGHGGIQTWADESIFRIEDVVNLRNRYLPFVITTTCLNGQFDKPQQVGNFCLSEQFLLGEYGAIAALSATRLTYGAANAEFDKDLFTSLFAVSPPRVGAIVTDAKIKFLTRIRNQQWIPGTEQYTLFGDPATRLARPDLEIQVDLERIAVNDTQELVVQQNEVGTWISQQPDAPVGVPIPSEDNRALRTWKKAADFSTEGLAATAAFANNFDDNPGNDLLRRTTGRVWQGEYGTMRIQVPNNALPGGGVVRLFAFNDTRSAVGGARFWVEMPVVQDVHEEVDIPTDTLSISVLIVDDNGAAGIRNISVLWDDTVRFQDATVPMVRVPVGSPQAQGLAQRGEIPQGGQWYQLQTPIPLPPSGRQIRYRIRITDTTGHQVAYPSKTERSIVKVPEGPNIAIGTDETDNEPIRYQFSEAKDGYELVAELINNGGRVILADIKVVFAEGNPDADGDSQVDEDADILGITTIRVADWEEGTYALQRATAVIDIKPLGTGIHKIYALADPEEDESDEILGTVQEARVFDNKKYISFVVNDFNYRTAEEITAFSLDRVFDIHFPPGVITTKNEGVPLYVSSSAPEEVTQPDIQFAPIPRVAALRRGLIRQGSAVAQRYAAAFRTGHTTLEKPAELKLRFDVSALEDIVRESTELRPETPLFEAAVAEIAAQLAIYSWQADTSAWRRLPSQITLRETSEPDAPVGENSEPDSPADFLLENYVTPIQTENASEQELTADNITINPNLTPAGSWVVLFLDASQYEVFLKRKGEVIIQKLDKAGQLDIPFREEVFGLELLIPGKESTPLGPNFAFEFADVLAFETDYDPQGDVILVNTRNANVGNGSASVNTRLGQKAEFEVGDWFIFFTGPENYEIRDAATDPVHLPNGVQVRGKLGENLFLSHLGLEILVNNSTEHFQFGDKIKFSSARVGTITAEVRELTHFALMRSTDATPPSFQIWVDGIQPQTGSVIPPRPTISMLIEDANGIDLETLTLARRKDGGEFEPIPVGETSGPDTPVGSSLNTPVGGTSGPDTPVGSGLDSPTGYHRRAESGIYSVPIDYKPLLFPGEWTFEIHALDFNGNPLGGEEDGITYRFFVTEEPDITPPDIEIQIVATDPDSDEPPLLFTDGAVLTEQPHFDISLTDDGAIDDTTFSLALSEVYEQPAPLAADAYAFQFDTAAPTTANVTFAPDLVNGDYHLHITAADTSQNTAELTVAFTLNEAVSLRDVFNVPNPTPDGRTSFTYYLAQPPDTVSIKIYTVAGRLIRTLFDASARRGTNETEWDGRDETGVRCANGVYLYRVIAQTEEGRVEQVGKLAILR